MHVFLVVLIICFGYNTCCRNYWSSFWWHSCVEHCVITLLECIVLAFVFRIAVAQEWNILLFSKYLIKTSASCSFVISSQHISNWVRLDLLSPLCSWLQVNFHCLCLGKHICWLQSHQTYQYWTSVLNRIYIFVFLLSFYFFRIYVDLLLMLLCSQNIT